MDNESQGARTGAVGLGTFSLLSIGIGGMVGGGIFAVTGLTIELTRGSAPLAFLIAGVVALLTSYSYLKLTLRYPSEGGTVQFIVQAFGDSLLTGAANILLVLSYVVLVAVYAYAFGSYGAGFFDEADHVFWQHVLSSGVIIGLLVLNILASQQVVRTENLFNAVKMLLLGVFVILGLDSPMDWSRLSPDDFVSPLGMVAGAMLIFLNYEGFELIANAADEARTPERSLPVAYIGGLLLVIVAYMLIVAVVIGHLDFPAIGGHSDRALAETAEQFMGHTGAVVIIIAALLATSSAINATFYSTGKLAYIIARSGQLPHRFEKTYRQQHIEGTVLTGFLAVVLVNLVSLEAIATMGSAGFLIVFMLVNIANCKLAGETGSRTWLSAVAALTTAAALVVLCVEVDENPNSRNHLWILLGMVLVSIAVEYAYRTLKGRTYTSPRTWARRRVGGKHKNPR